MFSVSFFLLLLSTTSLCYDPKEAPKPRGHRDSHAASHSLPAKPSFSPPRYVSPPSTLRQSRTPWNPKSYTESISPSRLLQEHSSCKTPSRKNFPNPLETLAYVTPWNSEGYENAKKFVTKFTYISPVWIQIKPINYEDDDVDKQKNKNNFILTGLHDVDQGWIKDLREAAMKNGNRAPLIVPRFAFENWQQQHYTTFASPISAQLISQIAAEVRKQNFDGLVLEGLLNFKTGLRDIYISWLLSLSKALHDDGKVLILVIPPGEAFDAKDFNQLAPHIDRFSLMTYDYAAHRGKAGPNAPHKWVHEVLTSILGEPEVVNSYEESESEGEEEDQEEVELNVVKTTKVHPFAFKILLGINFYGYDFGLRRQEAILGKRLIELLKEHPANQLSISWESESREHKIQYKDPKTGEQHQVWFPTLRSIQVRLLKAYEFGTGVSIWEIGQGLTHFYDLL